MRSLEKELGLGAEIEEGWDEPDPASFAWEHAPGPRSQRRWRNSETGTIRYMDTPPESRRAVTSPPPALPVPPAPAPASLPMTPSAASGGTASLPVHAPSGAEVTYNGHGYRLPENNMTQDLLARFVGRNLPLVADLVGALPGAKVSVSPSGVSNKVRVDVTHPMYHAVRYLTMKDRVPIIENVSIRVEDEHQKSGVGTEIFSRQVQFAAQHGFQRIECYACRSTRMNGHYTWPLLGYDTPLHQLASYQIEQIRAFYPHVTTMLELMAAPGGRAWWKQEGFSFDASFDLKEGSRSRQVLDTYRAMRQLQQQNKGTST